MSFFLLSSFSLMALVMMMTAALFVVGLWRAKGTSDYKHWLIFSLLSLLFWHGMGFLSGGLHPDFRELTYRYSNTLFNIGVIASGISFSQVTYLFPVRAFDQERKWALYIFSGIGIVYMGSVIWFHFIQDQTGLSSATYGPFVNTLAGLFFIINQLWSLLVLLRKSAYCRRHKVASEAPVLLLAMSSFGLLVIAFLMIYPGGSHTWVMLTYSVGFWLLMEINMVIYTLYSTFPIRFRDKLVGFTFASVMCILSLIIMVVVPFTTNSIAPANIAQRLADQPILVRLLWVALGSATFVLILFPTILKVSFMQPLQRLMLGIQQANQGDLSVQVVPDMLDEIGVVTQHFNRMAQSLKQSKDELMQHAETLEQRVDERTDQLNQSLSALRATQAQLIHQEKLASLGELTAGIAHEIQNPLNFVANFSEVSLELINELKSEVSAGNTSDVLAIANDLSQNIHKITQHSERASGIVKGMLEHSRSYNGQKQSTDLNRLVDEQLQLVYQRIRAKDTAFSCDRLLNLDATVGVIDIAPQEMSRVLLNLFTNAFYAMQEKHSLVAAAYSEATEPTYTPTLTVNTRRLDTAIEIRIHDNGTGIQNTVKGKIFQPFFTTKPTGKGVGLGLSLSYDIITKGHGGSLSVTSEADLFTEFIIILPASSKPID